jgi:hypothetical protein
VASKSTTLTEVSFHPGNGNELYPMYGIECAQEQKISRASGNHRHCGN